MAKNDKIYDETIHSQADMSLKYLGRMLAEEEYDRIDNESKNFEIPEYLDSKLSELIKENLKQEKASKRRKALRKFLNIACIFIASFTVICAISYKNVSAFRYKFDNFISNIKKNYIELIPNSGSEADTQLTNIWLPEYIPDGYDLYSCDVDTSYNETNIIYKNIEGDKIVFTYIEADNTNIHLDNETDSFGTVKLNSKYTAYWNKNGNTIDLCWLRSDNIYTLKGIISLEELEKIAESIKYKE